MIADVRWLADDAREGRGTGTPGALATVEWLEARLREIGLEPGGSAGYRQVFEVTVASETVAAETSASIGGAALQLGDGFEPAPGSGSGDATGAAVFVEFGVVAPALGRDDYAGKDVTGKVVVVRRGAPPSDDPHAPIADFGDDRYKIRTARERGAIAVVLVGAAGHDAVSGAIVDMGLPAIVVHGDRDPGTIEGQTVSVRVGLRPVRATAYNVIGVLRGADARLRAEALVVGAHHDHLGHGGTTSSRAPGSAEIHNGADDNASGTSLVLELARQLAGRPPPRTIAFAFFGAEELGVLGSRHFLEDRSAGLSTIVAMLNADMVGRMRGDRLVLEGAETSSAWMPILLRAAEGLDLRIDTTADGFGASDHTSFYAAGIPVANLFTGVHDEYHRPEDDADLIDAEGMRRVATFALRFVGEVAALRRSPDFQRPPERHSEARRGGFRVSLGTVPDYGAQVRGVRLSAVRPGSPSERAGLRAGDVVVGIGEHEITNIYDYTFMLRELEPGVTVSIAVERAGARIELPITPAPGR